MIRIFKAAIIIFIIAQGFEMFAQQDYSLIYVQRLKKSSNSDVTYKVWFNDQKIGELQRIPVAITTEAKQRWLISKREAAGKFYVRVTGKKDEEVDKIVIDARPGRSVYITFDPSIAYGQKALKELPIEEGHELFAKADMDLVTFAQNDIIGVVKKNKNAILEDLTVLDEGSSRNGNQNSTVTQTNTNTQPIETKEENIIYIINPVLTNDNHYVSSKAEVDLRGKLTTGSKISTLLLNGEMLSYTKDYFFEKNIILSPGVNTVYLAAKDASGTTIDKKKITIDYQKSNVANNAANVALSGSTNYYALLIAINEYQDPEINDLDNPISDAEKLYSSITKNYTFDSKRVTLLKDAKYADIIIALDELTKKITPNDNLLIFYAGHGYWDEKSGVGYWLPADAAKANTANWFRNSTLKDYIGSINSKHTILIADACFSGGIFKTRSAFGDASVGIQKLYDLPSRKAMTSGTLKEVPDKSAFLQYLVKRLDENQEKYLSSEELFSSFRAAVLANSPTIPQFGEIKDVGDEGGDFIFIKRGK